MQGKSNHTASVAHQSIEGSCTELFKNALIFDLKIANHSSFAKKGNKPKMFPLKQHCKCDCFEK